MLFEVDQARAAGAKVQLDDMGLAFGEPLAWWQL